VRGGSSGWAIRSEETRCKLKNACRPGLGLRANLGTDLRSVQASHAFPDLFHSLILVDPMTRSLEPHEAGGVAETLVRSCIGRRDTWPSLRAAEEDLLRSPFFRAWDERVFRSFLQHGLCPLTQFSTYAGQQDQDEGSVGLMTPRWAEATVFAGGPGMLVGYDKLSELRRDMKVTFIMAEDPSS
jgi:hypothetical protein